MYKILKLILPLLLVVSACKKESLPLNYLEGGWYYQYYNVHDVKIDGDPSKTVWEKTFEEPYTDGIRIQKSGDGYTFCTTSGGRYGNEYPLTIEGNRLICKDFRRIFDRVPVDVVEEWQVVRLTPEIMEVKCDTYYNKYHFPPTSGDVSDHYYEAHATLTLVKRAE